MKSLTVSNLFVVTIFVCLSMQNVSSLQCYACESNLPTDKSCSKLDSSKIVTCSPEQLVCRTLKAGYPEKGFNLIQRSCGTLMQENIHGFVGVNKQYRVLMNGVAVNSMICNTDLCNAASAILKTSPTICLLISVILFLKHVY